MRSKSFIIIGLIITSTISISGVYAFGLEACDNYTVSSGANAICQRVDIIISQVKTMISNQEDIKHQNKILIKEQNQTNTLLAMEFCKGSSTYQSFPVKYHTSDQQYMNDDQYSQCVKKVLGDTK